jgi:hypothetical protein
MEACELLGMPIELAMFIQKGEGKKGWVVYLGFKMEKDKRSSSKDDSQIGLGRYCMLRHRHAFQTLVY